MSHRELPHASRRVSLIAGVLIALAGSCLPANARADALDSALYTYGKDLVSALAEKGYKNVGVLQFGLKRPDRKDSLFNAGPINKNMAEYVEDALVCCNPTKNPLIVLRDTNKEALKNFKELSLNSEADRRKLLNHSYKTWDVATKSAKPDAMVFGVVELKQGFKKCEVTILAFDSREPSKTNKVYDFEFDCDNYLLADSGIGFSLSRKFKTVRRFDRTELDDLVNLDQVRGGADPGLKPTTTPGMGGFPVVMTLLYKGQPQIVTPDAGMATVDRKETYNVPQPTDGEVVIRVKNVTDQKVGIVLMVGGRSTLNDPSLMGSDEEGELNLGAGGNTNSRDADMWVLEPNKEYSIKGYYVFKTAADQHVYPFKVLSDTESDSLFMSKGDAARQIMLQVFRPATEAAALAVNVNSRSLRQPLSVRRKAASAKDLIDGISKQTRNMRGFIGKGDEKGAVNMQTDTLANVALTDAMVINLMAPAPLGGLGGNKEPETVRQSAWTPNGVLQF
jgi:hypothetical protein